MGSEIGHPISPDSHTGQSPISSIGTITQATSPTFFNNGRRPSMSAMDSALANNGDEDRRGGLMGRITNAVRGRSASRNVKEREKNTKSPGLPSDQQQMQPPQLNPNYNSPYGTMLETNVNGQTVMMPHGEAPVPQGAGGPGAHQKAERHPRDIRRDMSRNEIRMGMI